MIFKREDVGVKVSADELIALMDNSRSGGFMYIHGYISTETGEIANHWVKGSCSYPNMVARSIAMIDNGSLRDKIKENGLMVARGGIWKDELGEHLHEAKGRTYKPIPPRLYSPSSEEDSVKLAVAIAEIRHELVSPRKVKTGFVKKGKGTFVKEGEAPGVVYFRDCLEISKIVTAQGKSKTTASDEIPAIKKAIRKLLPVGRYCSYKLTGNFEYINIDGQSIMQGADVSQWDMMVALKEDVREAVSQSVSEPVTEHVVNHIMGDE